MQVGLCLKILKIRGPDFQGGVIFGAIFKNQPSGKKSPYIFDSVL